jgi:hypothetical protein
MPGPTHTIQTPATAPATLGPPTFTPLGKLPPGHLQIALGVKSQGRTEYDHQWVGQVQRQVDGAAAGLVHRQRHVGQLLRALGSGAVHGNGACPQQQHPCVFGNCY